MSFHALESNHVFSDFLIDFKNKWKACNRNKDNVMRWESCTNAGYGKVMHQSFSRHICDPGPQNQS